MSEPYVAYTPSLVEISIVVGAFAFVAFVYTLAERYLDLREAEAHVGFRLPAFVATARERLAARRARRRRQGPRHGPRGRRPRRRRKAEAAARAEAAAKAETTARPEAAATVESAPPGASNDETSGGES